MITIEVGKHTSLIYLSIPGGGHLSISMDVELDSREQRAEQRADARLLIERLAELIREGHPVTVVYTESAQTEMARRLE